jgi:hypothetical protein
MAVDFPLEKIKYDYHNYVLNRMFSISDELMFHAKSIEMDDNDEDHEKRLMNVSKLLDELDRVNIQQTEQTKVHWSNFRDLVKAPTDFLLMEGRKGHLTLYEECKGKTFLAYAIQAKLVFYVKQKLENDPKQMKEKGGRPLLDYALRLDMIGIVELREPNTVPDIAMVRLLLDHGADPMESVYIYGRKRVWHLFLILHYNGGPFSRRRYRKDVSVDIYPVIELLVQNGAELNCKFKDAEEGMVLVTAALREFLTEKDVETLQRLHAEKKRQGVFDKIRSFIGWG